MTKDQQEMLSIKSTIEHTIRAYCKVFELPASYITAINTYAENLQLAGMIKEFKLVHDNKKLDFTFSTHQGHGCTLTYLIRELKGIKYVSLKDMMKQYDISTHFFSCYDEVEPSQIEISNVNILSNQSLSLEMNIFAVWYCANTTGSGTYIVPHIHSVKDTIQKMERIAEKFNIPTQSVVLEKYGYIEFANFTLHIIPLGVEVEVACSQDQKVFLDIDNSDFMSVTYCYDIGASKRRHLYKLLNTFRDFRVVSVENFPLFHKSVTTTNFPLQLGVDEQCVIAFFNKFKAGE